MYCQGTHIRYFDLIRAIDVAGTGSLSYIRADQILGKVQVIICLFSYYCYAMKQFCTFW